MKRVNELSLSDNVKHIGYIEYKELPYLYKMSKMLIMPSLFESVSIPIYEAFALDTPVCSANVVALPEQIGDGGVTFDPHCVNDMASKIMTCLYDEKTTREKSKIGFESVKNFNHTHYKNKLISIL
jgi:glycosyltransferase involved in cell wall biosynthesis